MYPVIKLQLLKNGQAEGSPVDLTNGATSYTWTGLDKRDNQGNEYVYTVKEVGETGNSITLNGDRYNVIYGGNQQETSAVCPSDNAAQTGTEYEDGSIERIFLSKYQDPNNNG